MVNSNPLWRPASPLIHELYPHICWLYSLCGCLNGLPMHLGVSHGPGGSDMGFKLGLGWSHAQLQSIGPSWRPVTLPIHELHPHICWLYSLFGCLSGPLVHLGVSCDPGADLWPIPELPFKKFFPPVIWISAKLFKTNIVWESLAVIQTVGGKFFLNGNSGMGHKSAINYLKKSPKPAKNEPFYLCHCFGLLVMS